VLSGQVGRRPVHNDKKAYRLRIHSWKIYEYLEEYKWNKIVIIKVLQTSGY
ncbi:uncharacterized protein METZ01_LOCUS203149, partial [marine metagenome]